MNIGLETILVLLIVTCFALLGSSRLAACIRMAAWQGILAGLLPWVTAGGRVSVRMIGAALLVIGLKGFVFPRLLLRALRESETSREVQPFVGYSGSLGVGIGSLLSALWLGGRLQLPGAAASDLVVPVGFLMMMTGLFLIVARRTAVNQVVGYLVLETGIYVFGLAVVRDIPLLIELGVLMDVFVAVFVMGIAIYHINREFDHVDADRLTLLRG